LQVAREINDEGVRPGEVASDRALSSGARRVRHLWDRRAHSWEHHGSVGLERVIDAVVEEAATAPGMTVVDLGCGSGQLSIPLAEAGACVRAVDISTKMIELLRRKADALGVEIDAEALEIQALSIEPRTVDLVVSNYAMHHLSDAEKEKVVSCAATWLKPGGRLIIGDMMFGRGTTKSDRDIIASKVRVMLARGPAGWWRIAKNAARFLLRIRERPLALETWLEMLRAHGFEGVQGIRVVAEAAVVAGSVPVD